MRTVTFNELVPGMVLYPVYDVNKERNLYEYIVLSKTVQAGTDQFWGDKRALYFLDMSDPHMGISSTAWRTDDKSLWYVVDDQPTLDKIRAHVKAEINRHRDHLDECERLIDANT